MNATIKLLDKYREVCSLTSDNACAERLGVTRSAVSLWRGEKGHPAAESIEKMCAATGEPLARWLPLIEAERCRTAGDRRAWLRLAQIAAALLIAVNVAPAHAGTVSAPHNSDPMYIMSNVWRRIRRAGMRLASRFAGPHGVTKWAGFAPA